MSLLSDNFKSGHIFLLNFKMYFLYALAKQPLEQDLQVRQFVDL